MILGPRIPDVFLENTSIFTETRNMKDFEKVQRQLTKFKDSIHSEGILASSVCRCDPSIQCLCNVAMFVPSMFVSAKKSSVRK